MNVNDFISKARLMNTLSKRSFSTVEEVEFEGVRYARKRMHPNGPNGEVTKEILVNSYNNYVRLDSKPGLVVIHTGWWDGQCFNTVMDLLPPEYRPMALFQNVDPGIRKEIFIKSFQILASLMCQGYCDYDPDPSNFMYSPAQNKVLMLDLDKIMTLDRLCEDRSHYGSWFASRMVRMNLWLVGKYNPHLQYTEVKKL